MLRCLQWGQRRNAVQKRVQASSNTLTSFRSRKWIIHYWKCKSKIRHVRLGGACQPLVENRPFCLGLEGPFTSRKRLIGRKSCHGALPKWCATAKYAWRTVRGCATDSNLAVAQVCKTCATAKMGPGRRGLCALRRGAAQTCAPRVAS